MTGHERAHTTETNPGLMGRLRRQGRSLLLSQRRATAMCHGALAFIAAGLVAMTLVAPAQAAPRQDPRVAKHVKVEKKGKKVTVSERRSNRSSTARNSGRARSAAPQAAAPAAQPFDLSRMFPMMPASTATATTAPGGSKASASRPSYPVMALPAAASGGQDIVAEARRHIGTNPTGWSRLWCGRFMNLVLTKTGYETSGSNEAKSFASYGRRIPGPRVGAIAVVGRGMRSHVGVVSGVQPDGDPVVISGNWGRKVAEASIPKSNIIAYVVPN